MLEVTAAGITGGKGNAYFTCQCQYDKLTYDKTLLIPKEILVPEKANHHHNNQCISQIGAKH